MQVYHVYKVFLFFFFVLLTIQAQTIFDVIESQSIQTYEFSEYNMWSGVSFDQVMHNLVDAQTSLKKNTRRRLALKMLKSIEKEHPILFEECLISSLVPLTSFTIATEPATEIGKLLLTAKNLIESKSSSQGKTQVILRQELEANPLLVQALKEKLIHLQKFEDIFISFWDDALFSELVARNIRIYFRFNKKIESWLNLQPWAVELRDKVQLLTRIIVIPLLIKFGFNTIKSIKKVYWDSLLQNGETYDLEEYVLRLCNPLLWLKFPVLFYFLTNSFGERFENPWLDDISKNIEEVKSIGTLGEEKSYYQQIFALRNCLHKKLIGLANYIQQAQSLVELAQRNKLLEELLLQKLNLYTYKKKEQVKKLLRLLQSSTFTGSPSSFNQYTGRILVAYRLISQLKEEFLPLFFAVGQLDAAVARL